MKRIPLRWVMAILLMLLSVLNYIDRQTLSILATTIQHELKLTDLEYARVGQAFLLCYTVSYLAAGRLVDWAGARAAETLFVSWWSVASIITAWATGFGSLALFRGLLGLGESGHYSVSAKVVGQWFPPREKGIAAGMYTMGGTLGAAIAAPLVAWITVGYGWRAAFIFTGIAGLGMAVVWWLVYRAPAEHPWLSEEERAHLSAHRVLEPASARVKGPALGELIQSPALWLILCARMLTDPVWYFYLVWFAKYLQEMRGWSLLEVGATVWMVFIGADIGCLGAGLISGLLIKKGFSPVQARLQVIAATSVLMMFSFIIPFAPGMAAPIVGASLFAGCTMMFMTSCVTLPLDIFPKESLGTVQGLVGMGGSIGGFLSTGLIGSLLTTYRSYDDLFLGMSILHPLAAVLLLACLPRYSAAFPARPAIQESRTA